MTNGFLDELRKSCVDATVAILKTLGSFWLKIPSPDVRTNPSPDSLVGVQPGTSTAGLGSAGFLQANLAVFTLIAAVVGLMLCAARMGMTAEGRHGAEGAKMLVRLIAVAGAGGVVVALLIDAGDQFSPWLINQATGAPFDQTAPSLIGQAGLLSMTPFLTILVSIFAIFGAVAQIIFMILRGGLLIVLVAVWPLAASMSTTEQGMSWYKKINAWIIAFVLLKPVSAVIYSAGFLLLKGMDTNSSDPTVGVLMGTLSGLAILGLAGLALPALLKFVNPMAAAGAGAMSGGAALGSAVAVGATVVTVGAAAATGGASAGAGGASSAGGASGGANGAGTTSGTGSGRGTGSGGATTGGGGGPSGGSMPGGGGDPTGGSPSGGGPGGGGGRRGSASGAESGTGAENGSGGGMSEELVRSANGSGGSSSANGAEHLPGTGAGADAGGSRPGGSGRGDAGPGDAGPGGGPQGSRGGAAQWAAGLRETARQVNEAAGQSVERDGPDGASGGHQA